MIIYFLILIALCFIGCRISDNQSYLDKNQTTAIKGVFTIIVFLSHCKGYFGNIVRVDNTYYILDYLISWIGQLMVAPFLFYSGYGIIESFKKKERYIQNFLKRRIIPTIGHFAIALVPYIIINRLLVIYYPIQNYIFCWLGWESIGNSNWYIFDIILLYTLTLIIFRIVERFPLKSKIVIMTFASMLVIAILKLLQKEAWWYNTILCYPLGMLVSVYKDEIEQIIDDSKLYWIVLLIFGVTFFCLHRAGAELAYMGSACLFCFIVVLVSKRVKIGNEYLNWIGMHLFEIYILQRIPMTILSHFWTMPAWLFTMASWIMVCILAVLTEKIFKRVDEQWRNCCELPN